MKVCTACGIEYGDDVLFCQRDGTPLRSADVSKDLVGQIIAERYHVLSKLGEGGMGQVYLAEHVKMGRRCAIKIMSAGMMNDPDAVSRFNREAANASRISHPNVCAIYDFGETKDGLIYLAMEFVEGKSLTDLLRETGPLGLPRAATILTQSAEALQAAHDLGIVHRDLKPDNIMVITTRGKDVVKVVDFGIAKAAGPDLGGQKVTKTGLVVGTPEYMSPEQLSGDRLDGRSDIYSLALVFYRMLTGRLPFRADSAQETMVKRLTDDPIPLAEAKPDGHFPDGLQAVMDRALARWPTNRYPAANEFGHDVTGITRSLTGKVDTESATQMVRASRGQVPETRVHGPKADKADKAGGTVATRRFPVVPVAAVGVLLVAAGGAYAARGTLFGGEPVQPVDTKPHDSASAGGTSDTATTKDPDGAGTMVAIVDSARLRPPPDPGTGVQPRDTTKTKPPPRPPVSAAQVDQELNALQDSIIEVKPRRGVYRSRAEALFSDDRVSRTLRAKAAATVGQAYLEDEDLTKAREWFVKATALDGKYQANVDLIDRRSQN